MECSNACLLELLEFGTIIGGEPLSIGLAESVQKTNFGRNVLEKSQGRAQLDNVDLTYAPLGL